MQSTLSAGVDGSLQASPEAQAHAVRCMEIWGGNEAIDSALSVTGIDAWVYSRPLPGNRSGGDVHYVSLCGGGKIARFAVMDVAGHGVSVSELALKLRGMMRKHINHVNQAGFAAALNEDFARAGEAGQFATAILTSYFAPSDHLVVLNAGHPPPLWYRAGQKCWQFLEPEAVERVTRFGNVPLGVIEPTEFEQFAVKLEKHDLILIYTDALIEALDARGTLLGTEGLLKLVKSLEPGPVDQLVKRLLAQFEGPSGYRLAEDDATMILLHHNAADPPGLSIGETVRVIARMLGLVRI